MGSLLAQDLEKIAAKMCVMLRRLQKAVSNSILGR